jgi:hypothetical protein
VTKVGSDAPFIVTIPTASLFQRLSSNLKAYGRAFDKGPHEYTTFVNQVASVSLAKNWARVRTADDFWHLPKVSLLLNDITVLYGAGGASGAIEVPMDSIVQEEQYTMPREFYERVKHKSARPGLAYFDMSVVQKWLTEAAPLIEAGRLIYVPARVVITHDKVEAGHNHWLVDSLDQTLPWNVLSPVQLDDRRNVALVTGGNEMLESISELLAFELPYIRQLTMADFHKLLQDERDTLISLRGGLVGLTKLFRDKAQQAGDLPELKKMAIEWRHDVIEPELAKLNIKYKSIVSSRTFSLAGATMSTAAVAMACIFAPSIAATVALFGTSGFCLSMKEFAEYRRDVIGLRESPYYFLWKLRGLIDGEGKKGDADYY